MLNPKYTVQTTQSPHPKAPEPYTNPQILSSFLVTKDPNVEPQLLGSLM